MWYTDRTNGTDRTDRNLLKVIYLEHGPPLVIQSDQGREFKGAVEKLCREMKIKQSPLPPTISRESGKKPPFLREKMAYDFMKMTKKGVNWVKQLPIYQRILNEDPKEVLKYRTAFQVHYARKPVLHIHKTGLINEELLANAGKCHPIESAALNMLCGKTGYSRCN